MRSIKIFILLLLLSAVGLSQQPKSNKAMLLHQSTGSNYYGVYYTCLPNPTTNIALQVPVYNDDKGLTGSDTVSFAQDGLWLVSGDASGQTSWNNIHHAFDGDIGFTNSYNKLLSDTAQYGVMHIKTCFSWEAGYQSWTGSWSDTLTRDASHNMYTSKWHIMGIVQRMAAMNSVKWVLWTMPAGPQNTSSNDAASWRDRQLARWMKDTLALGLETRYGTFPSNVYIFDIFGLASDAKGEQKEIYSCSATNSHPNATAIETFSPVIVAETFDWALYDEWPKYIIHPYPRKASMIWTPTCAGDMARFNIVMGSHYDTAAVRRARALTDSTIFLVTRDYNQGGIFSGSLGYGTNVPDYFAVYDSDGVTLKYAEGGVNPLANWSSYSGTHPTKGTQNWAFQADSVFEFFDWSLWDGIHSDGTHHTIFNSAPSYNGSRSDLDRNGIADWSESSKGASTADRMAWTEGNWHWGWNAFPDRLRDNWRSGGYMYKYISMWQMGSAHWPTGTIIDTCGVKQWNGEEWENAWNSVESNNIGSQNTFGEWYAKYQAWNLNSGQSPSWHVITIGMNGATGRPASLGERDWWYERYWIGLSCMTDAYICFHHTYNTSVDHESALYYDDFDIPLGLPTGAAQTLSSGAMVRFFQNGAVIFNPASNLTSPYARSSASRTVTLADIQGLSGYAGPYYQVVTNQDTSRQGGSFSTVTLTTHSVDINYAGDALFLLKWQDTVISNIIVDNASFPTSPGSDPAVLTGFTYDAGASAQSTSPRGTGTVYNNPTYTNCMHFESGDATIFTIAQMGRQHYAQCARGGTYTAVYTPKINRAGYYRVSAWFGWMGTSDGAYTETDSAKVRIYYYGGDSTVYVNQYNPSLRGQWNVLGTFYYDPLGNKNLVLSNDGNPTKYVLADAYRWEYISSGEPPEEPEEPPDSPTLISPCGSPSVPIRPTFYWNPPSYADSYRIQVSEYSNFVTIAIDQSGITSTSYTPSINLSNSETYYWRVNATNEYGTSGWSTSCTFTTVDAATPTTKKYLLIKQR